MRLSAGLDPPGPTGGAHSAPQTLYLDSRGPTSKGMGGMRPTFVQIWSNH